MHDTNTARTVQSPTRQDLGLPRAARATLVLAHGRVERAPHEGGEDAIWRAAARTAR